MKRFLKVIDCTQQLQVRENVVGFEKALGAAKVIKDQIQYRSQSLLNLARGYFSIYACDQLSSIEISKYPKSFVVNTDPMELPGAHSNILWRTNVRRFLWLLRKASDSL